MRTREYYYQIDYIDSNGLANYIETYHDREQAVKAVNLLNHANRCLNRDTKFVLDKYSFYFTDEGEPVGDTLEEENITESVTIIEHIERVKSGYYKDDVRRNLL